MRILQIHKYLYRKAGAEAYMLGLADLLSKHGHEVGLWGTDEKIKIQDSKFKIFDDLLVEALNFDKREGWKKDFKKFKHMVWSKEAAEKFEKVLKRFKPDVIHVHNIYHHISPSILPVARKYNIPVVMSVHDYKLINPNYVLYDHGEICERDNLGAILHRCIKNSYAATIADVLEMTVHRMLGVYESVAKFIVPTTFVKRKLVERGVDVWKIETVPLMVEQKNIKTKEHKNMDSYILYAGRLMEEKGIYLLLEVAKKLPEINFKIAGTGPELRNVELRIKDEELSNIELLGFVEKDKLEQIIAQARLVVVPSLWYEPSPLAVLEAMSAGKVVVATQIGGIANLIDDRETGFTLETSNVVQWVDQIQKIWHDDALLKKVGKAASDHVRSVHNPEDHYEKIMEIYRAVCH